MTPPNRLEEQLAAALEAEARELTIAPDAWQQNQRRLAAARSRHSRHRLAAAAALVAVLFAGASAVVGASLLGGSGVPGAGGSSGAAGPNGSDPFAAENLLAEPVQLDPVATDGRVTTHEVVFSDTSGTGPQLCERYETSSSNSSGDSSSSSGGGSCTPREEAAGTPSVAFDWLTGTGADGDIRGVTAVVDDRVAKVRIWMHNGDMTLADLQEMPLAHLDPPGPDGLRVFAFSTTFPAAPTVQRLVAYGRDGAVLQAVDVPARFGDGWLPSYFACSGDSIGRWPFPGRGRPDVAVRLGGNDALVTVRTGREESAACLPDLSGDRPAGAHVGGDTVVAVVAPETEVVRLRTGGSAGEEVMAAETEPAEGSPWRVAVLRDLRADELAGAELIAFDGVGQELGRRLIDQPATP